MPEAAVTVVGKYSPVSNLEKRKEKHGNEGVNVFASLNVLHCHLIKRSIGYNDLPIPSSAYHALLL